MERCAHLIEDPPGCRPCFMEGPGHASILSDGQTVWNVAIEGTSTQWQWMTLRIQSSAFLCFPPLDWWTRGKPALSFYQSMFKSSHPTDGLAA